MDDDKTLDVDSGELVTRTAALERENRSLREALAESERLRAAEAAEQRLLNDQLLQAQKMEAVGRLAAGVAHDFNNLLTVVTGYSSILLAGPLPPEPKSYVQEIAGAARRAAALTRQLLAFSRRQIIQLRPLNPSTIVRGMENMLRRLLAENVDLVINLTPPTGLVRADSGQLEQVIMNLAVNSGDAMPDGGVLRIETSNVELDDAYARSHVDVVRGPHVLLTVSDTGTGMDVATMGKIFEPFFTTKEPTKGTGLGLSTVYGIVKEFGGHISVTSEPGRGTTFSIYLVVIDGPEHGGKRVNTEAPVAAGNETILLVEDEDAVRRVLHASLQRLGYTVIEAESGAVALERTREYNGRIDILVTDLMMPGMTGTTLAERMRGVIPGIRVVLISGYTDDEAVRHGLLNASDTFLQKPFTVEELGRTVRAVLDSAGQSGGA